MKTKRIEFLFSILLCMVGTKAFAYDIAVENADGVTIYYNYINDGTELEVTYKTTNYKSYSGSVVIPKEVTYMNRTRKVTSIGDYAFRSCSGLTSVTIPNSVTSIGDYAFARCSVLTSVTIPNSVTSIGNFAFDGCYRLTSVTIGNGVTSIGDYVFRSCSDLTSVTIPNSVTSIGNFAFASCSGLTSVTIPNSVTSIGNSAFHECYRLTSVTIPNSVTSIGVYAFCECSGLTSVTIPNSVTSIGDYAFASCSGLTSVTIPNSVTSIGGGAFQFCSGLTSVTIPNSVTSIGNFAFDGWDLPEVISKIENPFEISTSTFSNNTFLNASLYVPKGTVDKYEATEGWKKFAFIEEGNGSGSSQTEPSKCEKPTISYQNGKLTFYSATEGAVCHSTITDTDITSYDTNEVQLGVTYNISVYATKTGYENSETATATLCWIDVEPKTEGIDNGIAQVRANAVMIKAEGNQLTIEGVDDNTNISVYTLDGVQIGSAISKNGVALVNTNITSNSYAIVKIGNKSVKVIMK